VEDQQPERGAVTDDEAPAVDDVGATEETPAAGEPGETPAADGADEAPETGEAGDTEEIAGAGPPPGRRRPTAGAAAVALAVAAFVGAGAWAGAAVQPYLADRAALATRVQVARAATGAITTLWTYTPQDIGALPDRVADYLTGDLAAQYRKDIEAIAARYKQAEISLDSEVVGVAVDAVDGADARALVYTNTTWSSPQTKDIPGLQYRSYQVTLRRDDGRWRVARLDPITNFSLTPQF